MISPKNSRLNLHAAAANRVVLAISTKYVPAPHADIDAQLLMQFYIAEPVASNISSLPKHP
jgi:hypothetical protein